MLNRNELPADTLVELNRILAINPTDRIEDENAFLRARADYLNEEELANLPKASKAAAPAAADEDTVDRSEMSLDELVAEAESRELDVPKKPSVKNMLKLLAEADEADKEE